MPRVRMTVNQFVAVAKRAVQELPEEFRSRMKNLVLDVVDEPTAHDLDALEDGAHPEELLGIFEGASLLDEGTIHQPKRIKLFRRNLEAASVNREDLVCHIQETVVHEIAHHFGMTEEDLEPFERAMADRRKFLLGEP
jgi:predicted Zn-dependent protease with MMP-like domain